MVGLDGIRGVAALYVVLHHCYLMAFPGAPSDNGPRWASWMLYGHLAVVVFIVLSGFSLGLAPARHGWRLDSLRRFAFRRAWRILPPYWAALLLSMLAAWVFVPQPGSALPGVRSLLVYGLLVQDVIGAPTPNGAFWSIAIEAQLYLVMPLLLLLLRRAGAAVMVSVVLVPVVLIGLLESRVSWVNLFMRFTPQLAVGFAVGIVAAGAVYRARAAQLRWGMAAVAAALPAGALIWWAGPAWTVQHYLWVDLAVTPAIALMLIAVACGRPAALTRLLDTRPIRSLGSFSYSLYLIHAPIVVAVATLLVAPLAGSPVQSLLLTLLIAVPGSLLVARVFAALAEIPFQRHKSWAALRSAMAARIGRAAQQQPVAGRERQGDTVGDMDQHKHVAQEKTGWVRSQLEKIDAAGTTDVVDVMGRKVVVVTMRSAKTGKLRRVPLMRVEHEGSYAAVASKGGAPENPAWYPNMLANPEVSVLDGDRSHAGTARLITGDERAQWWERAVAAYPPYAEYQTKTDREIPVFVIEPS